MYIRRPPVTHIRWPYALLAAVVLAATPSFAQDTPAQRPAVQATKISQPINLDGKLDEPAWQDASILTLAQQSPRPGESTPYATEIRVLVSDDAIYFGFVCHDPQPAGIAMHTMTRDGGMGGDDTVAIVLDAYGDHRTGYFFQINSSGTRDDGLISDPQNFPPLDWDGIWDARTARTADGWSAEIVIPSRTLSFTVGMENWGVNFQRYVAREHMTLRWASPTLDAYLFDLSRAGDLSGMHDLRQGKGLEFVPYLLGKNTRAFGVSPRTWYGTAGGELTWKLTPQFVTVFTVNTDFAETEVDTPQVNLTRFPLFFPEKRAFFLEGANQYNFGLGLGSEFVPFFSRRIGLLDSVPIPLNEGVKLNGRLGKWNLAVLDVQTRRVAVPAQVVKDLGLHSPVVPSKNLLAGRVSYDVSRSLRVGTIFTNGDPAGLKRNTLLGLDAVWRTSKFLGNKNLLVGGWTETTQGDLPSGSRVGWGARVAYPNDLYNCGAEIFNFGSALQPALGFLPRPGTTHYNFNCVYGPRPSPSGHFGWIRQQRFRTLFDRYVDVKGITESRFLDLSEVTTFNSGDAITLWMQPQGETLLVPFQIAPGVLIPPGPYDYIRWAVEVDTSNHRPLQAGHTTWFGDFYNGKLTQWQEYVNWTSRGGRVQLSANFENDFARLPEGNFVNRLWFLKSTFAWSPNLVLSNFLQYNGRGFGSNTRLRWTIKPGDDLFVVWNRGWQRLFTTPDDLGLVPQNELIAVKLRWSFRY